MGLLHGVLGNYSDLPVDELDADLERLLAADESYVAAYRLVRDLLLLTDRRLVLVDRQGATGRRSVHLSVPYRSITRFAVETAGHVDLDAVLTLWTDGTGEPVVVEFGRGVDVFEVQALVAQHLPR